MERMAMSKVREILRSRWEQGRSVREAARALGVSTGVVSKVVSRAERAGIDWSAVSALNEDALEERLYGRRDAKWRNDPSRSLQTISAELDHTRQILEERRELPASSPSETSRKRKPGS